MNGYNNFNGEGVDSGKNSMELIREKRQAEHDLALTQVFTLFTALLFFLVSTITSYLGYKYLSDLFFGAYIIILVIFFAIHWRCRNLRKQGGGK